MLTCVVLLFYIIKVVAQINQHSNQQLTFKSIGLLVLIIVYYILVNNVQNMYVTMACFGKLVHLTFSIMTILVGVTKQ